MSVAIVGTGYVGLVTGAAMAQIGHHVICVDNDASKIAALKAGAVPIYEPGLSDIIASLSESGRLTFTTDLAAAVSRAQVIFICVGTPMSANGSADMCQVETVALAIGAALDGSYRVIVNKSTVPVGSGDWVAMVLQDGFTQNHSAGDFVADFDVVSNPEFLREGSAIADSFYPDRIVIGTRSERAIRVMESLYAPLIEGRVAVPGLMPPPHLRLPVPFLVTDLASAEMIKYAANSFLALKVSFINEMATICEHVGADITQVARGIGYDRRIGHRFLEAGLGWGGSCFKKDISALWHIAAQYGHTPAIIRAALDVNMELREECFQKIQHELKMVKGKTIGLMGLAFKPNTDDLRDAPALTLAHRLLEAGARVKAYDPVAMERATVEIPEIRMCSDIYDLAQDCDALVLVTDWPQFRTADPARLREAVRTPVLVDARNMFNPSEMEAAGFRYVSFGR
ncbi:MAG TPA: UDP-glucose/GDP-mannose dehydrogenase family protein [Armatimonadota bacterium]